MKVKRRGVVYLLLCCILILTISQEYLVAKEQFTIIGNERAQLLLKPKALPVVIAEENNGSVMRVYGRTPEKDTVTVETKKDFMRCMHDFMNVRKKKFTIVYKGRYTDIYEGNIEKMFSQAWNIDDKDTTDDGDYLYGNIDTYGFSIPFYSQKHAEFSFVITYRESASQLKKVNKKVQKVLKELNVEEKIRTEKLRAIHDYIAKNIRYDNSFKYYTAYAGLVSKKHSTVCQGYALLFYKMCMEVGIPCRYVTGHAGVPHAWNIVKVNGKWYHVDVTWDDLDGKGRNAYNYEFFLVGSATMKGDHTLDAAYRSNSFKKKYPIAKKDCAWSIPAKTPIPKPTATPVPVIRETPWVEITPVPETTQIPEITQGPWDTQVPESSGMPENTPIF